MIGNRGNQDCPTMDVLESIAAGTCKDKIALMHIESCASCKASLAEIRDDQRFLADILPTAAERVATVRPEAAPASDAVPGYEIVGELGRGGQATVYKAIQAATHRKVALKMSARGLLHDTRERHRFENEITLVAAMRHPYIVTVYESGITRDGRYYIAMEYIRGDRLDVWSGKLEKRTGPRDADVGLRAKLELIARVSEAVQYSHTRGIMHRDLKPSNILVDGEDNPRLLDFGIARTAMAGGDHPTMTGQFAGTPAFASPEQVSGSPDQIDTRTDIYSLGVVLYEMVTGHLPYSVEGSLQEIIRNITQTEPTILRKEKTATGVRVIDDDLETILRKAMAKDRERRYQTAADFGVDLRRYLAGEPLMAKRDSTLYVCRKWATRHKATVAGGVLVLAILAGASVVSTTFAIRAEKSRVEAVKRREESEAARAETEAAKDRIAAQAAQSDRVSELLRSVFLTPAPVLASADVLYEQTKKRAEAVFGQRDPNAAALLSSMGGMLAGDVTRHADAEIILKQAVEYQRAVLGDDNPATAIPYLSMSSMEALSNPLKAATYAREALRIREKALGDGAIETACAKEGLALVLITTARGASKESLEELEVLYREALAVYREKLGEDHARTIEARCGLGQALLLAQKYDEAVVELRAGLNAGLKRTDVRDAIKLTTAMLLADRLGSMKKKDDAAEIYELLPPLLASSFGEGSEPYKGSIAACASELRNLGAFDAAERMQARLRSPKAVLGEESAAVRLDQARVLFDNGQYAEAARRAAELVESLRKTGESDPRARLSVARVEDLEIRAKARSGAVKEARELAERAIALAATEYGADHDVSLQYRAALAEVLDASGDRAGAVDLLRALLEEASRKPARVDIVVQLLLQLERQATQMGDETVKSWVSGQRTELRSKSGRAPWLGGFENDDVGGGGTGWFSGRSGVGNSQLVYVVEQRPFEGRRCLRLDGLDGVDQASKVSGGFRNVMQGFDGGPYRGKKVRYSAAMRVEPKAGQDRSQAQLWMRSDRPNQATPSFFDNMNDRPVRSSEWKVYEIVGKIDSDAERIYFGVLAFGEAVVWIDDVKFEVLDDGAASQPAASAKPE